MLNFFKKNNSNSIRNALTRTQNSMFGQISQIFGANKIDDDTYEELQDILISSDLGTSITEMIMLDLESRIEHAKDFSGTVLLNTLKDVLKPLLIDVPEFWADLENKKTIVIILGVNGVGKTTSLSKLANFYKTQDKTVIAGAADTFRPAAVDQLKVWGSNVGFDVISHQQGADPGSVAFDTINAAKARNIDVALIDTAGRLHSESNLMNELVKIHKATLKAAEKIPVKVLINIDATTGQNGLKQAQIFNKQIPCDGIFLSKLDGTAKGGIAFPISQEIGLPIIFVGTGESASDLALFDRNTFIENIFNQQI